MPLIVIEDDRSFNRNLMNFVDGKFGPGGASRLLGEIVGLSEEAVRSRVGKARRDYPPKPLPPGFGLTDDDRTRLGVRCGSTGDPAIREFLQSINGTQRRSPDQEDARVGR